MITLVVKNLVPPEPENKNKINLSFKFCAAKLMTLNFKSLAVLNLLQLCLFYSSDKAYKYKTICIEIVAQRYILSL